MQLLEREDHDQCMKIYEIHVKNAEIKNEDENIVDAED